MSLSNHKFSFMSVCLQLSFFPVQFSRSVLSNSLRPHGLQHARPPCPSPTPRACSNSCPLSWWCHPTISSVVPFSCLQSFAGSGSFLVSQFFAIRWPKAGVSASFFYIFIYLAASGFSCSKGNLCCIVQDLWFECTDSLIAVGGFSCSKVCGILVPQPEIEPRSPCIARHILNHWITREVPWLQLFRSHGVRRHSPLSAKWRTHYLCDHTLEVVFKDSGLWNIISMLLKLDFPLAWFPRRFKPKLFTFKTEICVSFLISLEHDAIPQSSATGWSPKPGEIRVCFKQLPGKTVVVR